MRQAQEAQQWNALLRRRERQASEEIEFIDSISVDLSAPCTLICGRNGAGKSRLLRSMKHTLGDRALFIDIHHLAEQALIVLRSREDFGDMADEFDPVGPEALLTDDVQRIVGREYAAVEWFALDIEPSDPDVAKRFQWAGDQSTVPYFRTTYAGQPYTSREMGLGEFSIHFLFWILEQYRDVPDLVLLLDEPDAYLPPVGTSALLARLLRICMTRNWSIVLSSHSEELIKQASEHGALLLLDRTADGAIHATHSSDDPRVADAVLARPPVQLVAFCEDESASHLAKALLDTISRPLSRSSTIIWNNGNGYLVSLQKALPRVPRPDIDFVYLFDGDQRGDVPASTGAQWAALFLPTDQDPDSLFKSLHEFPEELATRLGVETVEVAWALGSVEGQDPHDWVNGLAEVFGRAKTLQVFGDLWCEKNPDAVAVFAAEFAVDYG